MTITKEYCDRCGKEVKSGPLDRALFPIICKSPKYHIRFSENYDYCERSRMICKECMKDYWDWWKKGAKSE